jgi:2,4-dienoyl-CoA reductase (NADPH2)
MVQQWVPAGAFAYLSAEVKKATKLPVVASYRIDDPFIAEKILEEGKADFIGLARALIADPEFTNKAKESRYSEIRKCIACCRCLDNAFDGIPIACTVNANLGLGAVKPAAESRKVLIVGGGPSGMEAARIAAMRGHNVTLCDKDRRLGGLMNLGVIFNDKLESLLKWMPAELKKLPVEVRLKTKVTPDLLEEMKPDVIIVATGGEPVIPQVPGINGDNVLSGRDIKNLVNGVPPKKGIMWRAGSFVAMYLGGNPGLMRQLMGLNFPIKKRVAILGGQFAGFELALTLIQKGKKVTIIEESKRLGNDIGPVNRWLQLDMLKKGGVSMEAQTKVTEITPKGVKVSREGGKKGFIEADTIILALGLKPNPAMANELKGKAPAIYSIGDVAEGAGVRRIREAIASGYEISSRI